MEKASLPTVLIAGCSGFFGGAITQGLRERNRVIGLDVSQPRNSLVWITTATLPFGRGTTTDIVSDGLTLIGLSLPRGTHSDEHYGGRDRAIV